MGDGDGHVGKQGEDERSQALLREVVSDTRRLVSHELDAARTRAVTTAKRIAPPVAGLAGGMALAAVAVQLLLARPAIPPRNRAARRRSLALSITYLVAGGALCVWAMPILAREVSTALRRARREVERSVNTVEHAIHD